MPIIMFFLLVSFVAFASSCPQHSFCEECVDTPRCIFYELSSQERVCLNKTPQLFYTARIESVRDCHLLQHNDDKKVAETSERNISKCHFTSCVECVTNSCYFAIRSPNEDKMCISSNELSRLSGSINTLIFPNAIKLCKHVPTTTSTITPVLTTHQLDDKEKTTSSVSNSSSLPAHRFNYTANVWIFVLIVIHYCW